MGSIPMTHPFPSTLTPTTSKPKPPRASSEPPPPASEPPPPPASDPDFDSRLSQVRRKYRSGSGKKAEQRRSKRSSSSSKKAAVMLPPVPLREPRTSSGVKVQIGFTPYSEGLNGAAAGIGLAALLLVELGSGKGLLQFHAPPILFVQLYAAATIAALYIKWEKERISVWPERKAAEEAD